MTRCRWLLLLIAFVGGSPLVGCGSSHDDLPTQEKIQQQLDRDAAMRAEEDRLERESQQ